MGFGRSGLDLPKLLLILSPLWELIDLAASVFIISISRKGNGPDAVCRMMI